MKRILVLISCCLLIGLTSCKSTLMIRDSYYSANKDGFSSYSLQNKIPVFLKTCSYSKTTAVSVVIEGGSSCVSSEKTGLETLVFDTFLKSARTELRKVSTNASISYSVGKDFSEYKLFCPDEEFKVVFPVFLGTFVTLPLNVENFISIKETTAADIKKSLTTPEGILSYLAKENIYEDHPYASLKQPTTESLKNISFSDLKSHFKEMKNAARIKLVVSGNFSKSRTEFITDSLQKTIGTLSETTFSIPHIPKIKLKTNVIYKENPELASGYILGCFSAPSITSSDYIPFAIVTEYLDTILYRRIVMDLKAAESAGIGIFSARDLIGAVSLYNVPENTDMKLLFQKALDSFPKNREIARTLDNYKNKYIADIYSATSSASALCEKTVFSLEYFNDPQEWIKRVAQVESVTPRQVRTCFEKYITGFQWIIISGEATVQELGFEE